jgi:transcription antitermination factor NusG
MAEGILTFFPHFSFSKFPFVRPLFTSYVFICCDLDRMPNKVRFARGVSYIVSFGGKPAVIEKEVIDLIQDGVDEKGVLLPTTSLVPGQPVVILSGPLRDLKGVFERHLPDGERVRILLSAIAYSASVEISKSAVAKLPARATA